VVRVLQAAKRTLFGLLLTLPLGACLPSGAGVGGLTNDETTTLGISFELYLQEDSHTDWAVGVEASPPFVVPALP
jgi:hypothetical protein